MQVFSDLIILLNTLFGIRTIHLNFEYLLQKKTCKQKDLRKIGTIIVFSILILNFFVCFNTFGGLLTLLAHNLYLQSFEFVFRLRLKKISYEQIVEVLSLTHLKMSSGMSFRQTFFDCIREKNNKTLELVFQNVAFSQQKNFDVASDLKPIVTEVQKIMLSDHKTKEQLKNLVEKILLQRDFRHRSSKILSGLKFQSGFLTLFFLVGLLLNLFVYDFRQNIKLIIFASMLFILGQFWFFALGRRIKWKV